MIIKHGFWELYEPENPPEDAPPNAWYWRNGDVDWYDYSRALSLGKYVVLIGDHIVSAGDDATRLTLPEKFELIEMDLPFNLGDRLVDGVVVPLHTEFAMQALSARQLWLMAYRIGVTKTQVIEMVENIPDDDTREIMLIELTEPPTKGYERNHPAVEVVRQMLDIDTETFDGYWQEASTL
ncbi:tail fiber assembly protein [Agrobacterium phage Atu_ph02]|uniref:Uncharacterized protein n=1 Tax=Agrobacterium phage Atu_ph02 TaxID=2024261 RepID=A0A2L0UYY5_9CAUD|nr:tail fiber assembly protein [Agrobacterium phage Atu_ph02]AUZ94745.1 hypothetical protein [Agrobacterium phage Atu_ph02]